MGSAWLTSPDAASGQAGPDSAVRTAGRSG